METGRHHSVLEERVKALGITEEASAWLRKALHPPSFIEKVAIPDESFRPGVRLDFKPTATIGCPSGLNAPWDLIIVSIPGDVTGAVWCAGPAGSDFSGSAPFGGAAVGSIPLQECDALPGFYNGLSYGNVADSNVTVEACRQNAAKAQPIAFRTTYRSITTELVASSLYNGGTMIAAQVDNDWQRTNPSFVGIAPISGVGSLYLATPSETVIPMTNEDIALSCPGSLVGPAREGCYIPHRLLGPSQPFVTPYIAQGRVQMNDGGFNFLSPTNVSGGQDYTNPPHLPALPIVRSAQTATQDASMGISWWVSAAYAGTVSGNEHMGDAGFDRTASSVVIYRGLDPNASILVRLFVGLEVMTFPSSPYRTFTQPPASPDMKALHAYYMLANNMNVAYPAKYNQLGLLIPALTSAIATLGPVLLPAAKKVVEAVGSRVASMIMPKQATVPRVLPKEASKPAGKKKSRK